MVGSTQKGSRNERKLVNWFLERDWYAMRAGASGGGGDQALPDILAMREGTNSYSYALAIELKSWSDGKGQLKKKENEVSDLREIAERSSAEPVVVVWPDMRKSEHEGRYVVHADNLNENEKSFSVRNTEIESAPTLQSVVDRVNAVIDHGTKRDPTQSIWG